MLKIENSEVLGWEHAIRGMRNPMNSWDQSDSDEEDFAEKPEGSLIVKYGDEYNYLLGPNDQSLMMQLRNAGTDHRKFMRMIVVYLDITAPLYWWKEFDTYKVGTVANSCSTMHKIHAKEFTLDDFSHEHLIRNWGDSEDNKSFIFTEYDVPLDPDDEESEEIKFTDADSPLNVLEYTITALNHQREAYLVTKDKKFWWQMIQLLPSSYNQKRTVMLNYEVLANIYKSRRLHKLDEWHIFCAWIKSLPYSQLITGKVE